MEAKICVICGNIIFESPSEIGRRKTCSLKCRNIYLSRLYSKPKDAPCARCGKLPRVLGRNYCRKCNNAIALTLYHKNKTCPDAQRLTDEERYQYKKQKQARYREKYRDKLNEKQRRYYRLHYEVVVRNIERRRARKAGVISNLTQTQWEIIKVIYRYRCAYCGKKAKLLTKDHLIPLSKGGGHTANNIVPACRSCNSHKHTGVPPTFQPILLWSVMEPNGGEILVVLR